VNISPSSDTETTRLRAVARYRILDTAPDRVLTRISALAARYFDAPMAAVSIVARDRIFLAATHGLDVGVGTDWVR